MDASLLLSAPLGAVVEDASDAYPTPGWSVALTGPVIVAYEVSCRIGIDVADALDQTF